MAPIAILHLHDSLGMGGKDARVVRLMTAWGDRARHVTAAASDTPTDARMPVPAGIAHEYLQVPPPLAGRPSVARYEAIARAMRRFDLILTYGWGAIDGVMARRAFGHRVGGLPPLVHHEDGFGPEEATGLKIERNLYRRIALPAAHALAVPSAALEGIATGPWKQPPARVRRIAGGIATAAYARTPNPKALPGLVRREGEVVIGAVAPLLPAKNLPALVRAAGGLSGKFRLVIVGEGPERAAIEGSAAAMGITDRLVMIGDGGPGWRYLGLFDILAMPSLGEHMPTGVVEAMAAGLPVAAMPAGDVPAMVAAENAPFIAPWPTEVRLRDAIQALMDDAPARKRVGAANRAKAVAEYDEATMIAGYRALYAEALGRPGVLG